MKQVGELSDWDRRSQKRLSADSYTESFMNRGSHRKLTPSATPSLVIGIASCGSFLS